MEHSSQEGECKKRVIEDIGGFGARLFGLVFDPFPYFSEIRGHWAPLPCGMDLWAGVGGEVHGIWECQLLGDMGGHGIVGGVRAGQKYRIL